MCRCEEIYCCSDGCYQCCGIFQFVCRFFQFLLFLGALYCSVTLNFDSEYTLEYFQVLAGIQLAGVVVGGLYAKQLLNGVGIHRVDHAERGRYLQILLASTVTMTFLYAIHLTSSVLIIVYSGKEMQIVINLIASIPLWFDTVFILVDWCVFYEIREYQHARSRHDIAATEMGIMNP